MGFLDQLWGQVRNRAGQEEGKLPQALLSTLGGGEGAADQANGLSALIAKFRQAGLGDAVESWVSNGRKNQPVSPDQVRQALGDQHVEAVAQRAGMPASAVLAGLGAMLPKLVDSMTPNGEAPSAPDRAPLQKAAGAAPDQAPGEAEAPTSTRTTAAAEAVKQVDPSEPTQAGTS